MSAEQIRDSVLFVSGALNVKMGGPSIALTPLADRRTVYAKVSRYKLDEYLQLFDFASPSQTAEQRFATNVPLQRLFFMNSDFIQQHAERLAEALADEPDDTSRIVKAYRTLFGRAPTEAEITAGRSFLRTEAVKQYEDRRADAAKAAADAKSPTADATAGGESNADKPAPMEGMMAGVLPGVQSGAPPEKMLPVTTFGRYLKVLLSSNEFLFVS
jgi:hypothetical protein